VDPPTQSRHVAKPAAPAADPDSFTLRPLPLFKDNPRSGAFQNNLKYVPGLCNLTLGVVRIYRFNPNCLFNSVLIILIAKNGLFKLQNCHPTYFFEGTVGEPPSYIICISIK
jgi:hypothetical protein